MVSFTYGGFPGDAMVKNSCAIAGDTRDMSSIRVGKIPWRRKWQPTPVFLPGKSHGQRNLVGYSPQGHKESDMTEHTSIPYTPPPIYQRTGLTGATGQPSQPRRA